MDSRPLFRKVRERRGSLDGGTTRKGSQEDHCRAQYLQQRLTHIRPLISPGAQGVAHKTNVLRELPVAKTSGVH